MHRGRKNRLASFSSGLAMAVLLGTLLGLPFWLLGLFRVIRISGYWRAVDYVRRGRVLIVANHPSLIETLFLSCSGPGHVQAQDVSVESSGQEPLQGFHAGAS
jgi:hypothetical protein